MNKKKLPKAIRRPPDDMRETDAMSGALESSAGSTVSHEPAGPPMAVESDAVANRAEIAPRSEPYLPRDASASSAHAVTRLGVDVSQRRRLAEAIVERHANYSAVGGIIPLPVVNFASVTAIIVRMVKVLSSLYGVPFERDRARAIVLGVIGGLAPTAASTMTASTLLYLIPGSNLVGLAVSSVAASACTRKVGWIFVKHFERGATLVEFPAIGSR
jgi:uncharacterized protein (DUF697 family)